jgi:hypothetical protein
VIKFVADENFCSMFFRVVLRALSVRDDFGQVVAYADGMPVFFCQLLWRHQAERARIRY